MHQRRPPPLLFPTGCSGGCSPSQSLGRALAPLSGAAGGDTESDPSVVPSAGGVTDGGAPDASGCRPSSGNEVWSTTGPEQAACGSQRNRRQAPADGLHSCSPRPPKVDTPRSAA